MTSRERLARDSRIVQARLRGLGEAAVAERFGVSARHVRRVMAEHRESAPTLEEVDPLAVIQEVIDAHDAAIEELALLADRAGHEGTKLGAIKARLDAQRAKVQLLQAAGVLPTDLAQIWPILDVQRTARTLMFILQDEGVPQRALDRIADALEGKEDASASRQNGATLAGP